MNHQQDVDIFADALDLENAFYEEGYRLGTADGARSGRIEGRIFGLEKGFEKFIAMARLHGKAAIWEARLPNSTTGPSISERAQDLVELSSLSGSERLQKHIARLVALTDVDDLSTQNSEEAVSDFDDRFKDATAKATLIEKIIGENGSAANASRSAPSAATNGSALRMKQIRKDNQVPKTREMEDFTGLRKDLG